ncbi:MAG TPA: sigma 54-interacting transcriptional regulator, partial [Anaeromyxobacteraceae bacterium]|nr:sigma 54-interacting transcriptional regulator [Anaeromyxobacteraceae bacterium]
RARLPREHLAAAAPPRRRPALPSGGDAFAALLGDDPALAEARDRARRFARSTLPVLLLAETGTGKELLARAIHYHGPRAALPFVEINCAAIPDTLLESELFGHEKGAFTGAAERRLGRFELADTGTIFLDEIGEIPPALQVTLLKALEEREIRRVGAARTRKVDARIVAATNRDLHAMVRERTFREDLFFRLNVFPIHVPALRDRPEDIPPLVERTLAELNRRYGQGKRVRPEALDLLARHDFPGNVRDLQNVVERAFILADGRWLEPQHLPIDVQRGGAAAAVTDPGLLREAGLAETLDAVERTILERCLSECGSTHAMARRLGVNQSTVVRKLQKHGLRVPPPRSPAAPRR